MIKLIKRKIYKYYLYISILLIGIAVRINSHKLSALIILINIRRFNSVKSNFKSKKKILVFPKSGGNEDLIETYRNKKDNQIDFYLLPRILYKKIFSYYFDKNFEKDYYTKLQNFEDIKSKELYVNFLSLTFKSVGKYIKFDAFISFNLFYYAEKYFEEVCKNLNIKFIVLHKESAFNSYEEKKAVVLYGKFNDKSLSHKISVYSESQKKLLIKSKIANKNQVVVNGTPRSDYAFKLRKIPPRGKVLVFYLIEYNRGQVFGYDKQVNWKKLYKQTLKYLFKFAKKNPEIQIILKGKTGIHKRGHAELNNLPQNCTFIEGGAGHELLKNASVVIAFNSTILFETIASNRNLIVPNFNNENKIKKDLLLEIKNKKYLINSERDFQNKIVFYLGLKYKNKKISKIDIKSLKYFLGNANGNSCEKMKEFIERNIEC